MIPLGAIRKSINFSFRILFHSTHRKFLFRWLRSLQAGYLIRHKIPWITFPAHDYLESLQVTGKRVFEYGSGGSTLYWLKRGASVVSIEHNLEWYEFLKPVLPDGASIDYRLIAPEIIEGDQCLDPSFPDTYVSSDQRYIGYHFRRYVQIIDTFPDQYFDIILIDGRSRPSCIKHAISKVVPGGILIVDNAERDYYYSHTMTYLQKSRRMEFYGPGPCVHQMWQTDIFVLY